MDGIARLELEVRGYVIDVRGPYPLAIRGANVAEVRTDDDAREEYRRSDERAERLNASL